MDVFGGIAEGLQDLAGVFAEDGRGQAIGDGRVGKTDGIGDALGGADRGMLELDDQVSRAGLGVVERAGDRVDGRGGDIGLG